MMEDNSSSTSCDDKSDFNDNHPTRDALAEGLMSFLKPNIDNLYKALSAVKQTQNHLASEIENTYSDLDKILEGDDGISTEFQKYTDKIIEMKHQMTVIDNVLQSAHNRLESFTGRVQDLQKSRKPHFDAFTSAEKTD